jgi:hypothetical protein
MFRKAAGPETNCEIMSSDDDMIYSVDGKSRLQIVSSGKAFAVQAERLSHDPEEDVSYCTETSSPLSGLYGHAATAMREIRSLPKFRIAD